MEAEKILDKQFNHLVATLQKVITFNTEKAAPTPTAPFGAEIADCLNFVLNLAESFGLKTYNCDNFAGHADWVGTGKEVLGILGHLDVVPAKAEEWLYPPYAGEIHDGKLFGRGAMDDKGPMIACLFAVKALKESGFVPTKTVRLIFGCDEESGMQCVEHYFSKVPFPQVAFSPDGDFPVINREKGIHHVNLLCGKLPAGVTVTAGERANVVPSLCTATLPLVNLDLSEFENVTATKDGKGTLLTATGKAAHGSCPDKGINATYPVFRLLAKLYPQNDALNFVANKLCDSTGKSWGVDLHDQESGNLTCNLGVVRTLGDGTLSVTVDIRFPVTFNGEKMNSVILANTPDFVTVNAGHASEPLFVPSDSNLVATLMDVYNTTLGCQLEPLAIGGGTYSRCLPNCVAFGPEFPDEEQTIHMPNECIDLENLKLMTKLYMEAIYRLAK